MCATKALLAGDADIVADIYRKRIINRGASVLNRGVSYQNATLRSPSGLSGRATSKE
jgi:formate dehydrogenase iron-sulfur subunit